MEGTHKVVTRPPLNNSSLPRLPRLHSPVDFRPGDLYKHRKETAAVRDLWKSLADKRQKKLHGSGFRLFLQKLPATCTAPENNGKQAENMDNGPPKLNEEKDQEDSVTKSAANSQHSTTFLPKVTENSGSRPFSRSPGVTSPTCFRHDGVRSPLPYHTAITRRPSRPSSPLFQALTLPYEPLPHVMGRKLYSRGPTPSPGRDIKEWQNQIVKVVPGRPDFFQSLEQRCSSPNKSSRMTFRYPYVVHHNDPSCHFYKSWAKVVDKDFVISPEWASEKGAGSALKRSAGGRSDLKTNADGASTIKTTDGSSSLKLSMDGESSLKMNLDGASESALKRSMDGASALKVDRRGGAPTMKNNANEAPGPKRGMDEVSALKSSANRGSPLTRNVTGQSTFTKRATNRGLAPRSTDKGSPLKWITDRGPALKWSEGGGSDQKRSVMDEDSGLRGSVDGRSALKRNMMWSMGPQPDTLNLLAVVRRENTWCA